MGYHLIYFTQSKLPKGLTNKRLNICMPTIDNVIQSLSLEVIFHYRKAALNWIVLWTIRHIDDPPNIHLCKVPIRVL